MTICTKKIWFAQSILAGLGGAGWLGLLATGAVAQPAMTPASLPLYFEANQGQVDSPAQFIARGRDSQFLISADAAQFVLCKMTTSRAFSARTVRMQFVGANDRAQISGAEELSGKINYLVGNNPARWQTGVATYAKVQVGNIYPGVNLTYYGNQRLMEYDFTVAPGMDPGVIAIRFDGADKISINSAGELVLNLGDDEIRQPAPVIYQTAKGARKEIIGGYKMLDAHTVAFAVGDYDHSLSLVIDPILSYSTYFGGNGADTAWAVAVDTNGIVYIAGSTTSTQFAPGQPFATPGAFQTNFQGGALYGDAFVAKLDNLGTNLIYLTYFGGSADDVVTSLAVDNQGDAYVAGYTDSPNFPTTTNAPSRHIGGTASVSGYFSDGFVTELNPGGSNLVFSTYLGGAGMDGATGLALDAANNIYVTGYTYSTNFPVTTNAFQKHLAVTNWAYQAYYNANAFVTEITVGNTNLVYSSYFGGINFDVGDGIALDAANNVYLAGCTASTNFPTTNYIRQFLGTNFVDGHLLNGTTNLTSAYDGFVAKFTPGFANLVYSTLLGGNNNDLAYHLAVDGAGNAYVTGWTVSTNFPNTVTNLSILGNGLTNNFIYGYPVTTNAFLTQIIWNGSNAAIGYSTVFGCTNFGIDIGYGVAVDPAGNVFVCGASSSTNFPTLNATNSIAATNSGSFDAFVIAFGTNATSLLYSGYLGGANNDFGYGIAVDQLGSAYVVGQTLSANFPTNNARQAALNGLSDAFFAKIFDDPPSLLLSGNGSRVQVAVDANAKLEPELPRLFKLESSTNLFSTNWVVVPQPLTATNNRFAVTLDRTNKMRFFRLHAF